MATGAYKVMIDGFLLKKLISVFVHLIPGALLVLLLLLIASRWWPRLCNTLAIVVCCGLIAGSIPPISNQFSSGLEDQYPVLLVAPTDTAMILVLGSGHIYVEGRPANSVLMSIALARITEGVRLWKTKKEAYLAVSGYNFDDTISHAYAMQQMAVSLGVPAAKIVLFDQTRDTEEEIVSALEMLKSLDQTEKMIEQAELGRRRLVVASSAAHLPRAAMMLERHDALYSMAPTDFLTAEAPWYHAGSYFLRTLDQVLHEWVGMAWFRLSNL